MFLAPPGQEQMLSSQLFSTVHPTPLGLKERVGNTAKGAGTGQQAQEQRQDVNKTGSNREETAVKMSRGRKHI